MTIGSVFENPHGGEFGEVSGVLGEMFLAPERGTPVSDWPHDPKFEIEQFFLLSQ